MRSKSETLPSPPCPSAHSAARHKKEPQTVYALGLLRCLPQLRLCRIVGPALRQIEHPIDEGMVRDATRRQQKHRSDSCQAPAHGFPRDALACGEPGQFTGQKLQGPTRAPGGRVRTGRRDQQGFLRRAPGRGSSLSEPLYAPIPRDPMPPKGVGFPGPSGTL
jgi:hypothetical protein